MSPPVVSAVAETNSTLKKREPIKRNNQNEQPINQSTNQHACRNPATGGAEVAEVDAPDVKTLFGEVDSGDFNKEAFKLFETMEVCCGRVGTGRGGAGGGMWPILCWVLKAEYRVIR